MSNGVTELANLIPEIWSSKMYDELRSKILFANAFSREYEGEIAQFGDTVKVNQIGAATGEILTDDKQQFASEAMPVTQNSVIVNKRANAAFEITDTAMLQSMSFQSDMQESLVYAIRKQLEDDLIAALSAGVSTSAPDHDIAPAAASDLEAVDLGTMRTLLSLQSVPVNNRKLFLDPTYYGDMLDAQKLMSRDYVAGNSSEAGVADRFMGFEIIEHDGLAADVGYAIHPSALQLVMQQDIRIKISDLHAQNKHGVLISADFLYGYSIFDNKRYVKISA